MSNEITYTLAVSFKKECHVINLPMEYPNFTGIEEWAIFTSLTEAELDYLGASERSGAARLYAEENNIYTADGRPGMYLNDGGESNLIAIQDYYEYIGSNDATNYIYDATNFRLRELSLGYTFRNLFGDYKNLSISFVCRNLFFLYKQSPVDPDVSLSTANGLGGIDMFNYPSARSFGLNIKLNL